MRELSVSQIEQVSGATLGGMWTGAITGAVSMALSGGKWASNIFNLGIGQAIGVGLGLIVGGVGGALYGVNHTSAESENFFYNLIKNIG